MSRGLNSVEDGIMPAVWKYFSPANTNSQGHNLLLYNQHQLTQRWQHTVQGQTPLLVQFSAFCVEPLLAGTTKL